MQGLTKKEVNESRKTYGANVFSRRKRVGFVRNFFANFGDPMLKILLVALGINCVFIFRNENFLETFGIAAAILLAVIVSTVSEQGSAAAFEKLQRTAAQIFVRAIRDGVVVEIPIADIVVGDIVSLCAGDKIPADGVVISGNVEIDQSLVNGEAEPIKRVAGDDLIGGTVVTNGVANMRVTVVGDKSFYGKMAQELQAPQPKSPLKVKLEKLASVISIIGYIGAALVAFAYLFNALYINGETFALGHAINAATLVVSVIVMAVPEGLPMMITVVLAANMKSMMRDNVLVRQLNGIETAGSMNILFTDKTGTLTMGKLRVVKVITDDDRALGTVLRYNTSASVTNGRAIGGNFTDRILAEHATNMPFDTATVREQIPFTSATKFMQTTLDDGRILLKGAPEVIFAMCDAIDPNIKREIDELTARAYRLIACAIDRRMVGVIAIQDEIRPTAKTAVTRLQTAGVQTVMITGDALLTATAVATAVGIVSAPNDLILTSADLNKLTDAELCKILPRLRVVARALPSDKSRLVRVAEGLGLVVGMTGDGVNDAPALKSADVGFAMGSGTEVAKEAGDVVILDDNISSIVLATSYGRTIFKSIRKFIIFKLTINFVAMGISILAPFFSVGVPITVLQMLWINIVMDTLAGLAYGGEKPQHKYMTESPKKRTEPIINGYMWGQIIYASLFIGGLSLWFLMSPTVQGSLSTHGTVYAMTAFFAFFMFINILNAFNSRTHDINLASYMSLNKPFVWIMTTVTVAQILMIFFGGDVFRTVAIDLKHFAVVLLLALTIIPVDMLRKLFLQCIYGKGLHTT